MWPEDTPEQKFANMILGLTPEQFNEWADKCSIEDVARATEIIRTANQQLREQIECLQEEEDYYIEEELEYSDLSDARYLLSKFTLNGLI